MSRRLSYLGKAVGNNDSTLEQTSLGKCRDADGTTTETSMGDFIIDDMNIDPDADGLKYERRAEHEDSPSNDTFGKWSKLDANATDGLDAKDDYTYWFTVGGGGISWKTSDTTCRDRLMRNKANWDGNLQHDGGSHSGTDYVLTDEGSYMFDWGTVDFSPAKYDIDAEYSEVYNADAGGVGTNCNVDFDTDNPSDRRLKYDINLIGKSLSGLNIYTFKFKDDKYGRGLYQGVMSDEVPQSIVTQGKDGYDRVNYSQIDVNFEEIK